MCTQSKTATRSEYRHLTCPHLTPPDQENSFELRHCWILLKNIQEKIWRNSAVVATVDIYEWMDHWIQSLLSTNSVITVNRTTFGWHIRSDIYTHTLSQQKKQCKSSVK